MTTLFQTIASEEYIKESIDLLSAFKTFSLESIFLLTVFCFTIAIFTMIAIHKNTIETDVKSKEDWKSRL